MAPPSPSLSRRASRPLPSPLSFIGVSRSYRLRNAAPREDLPRQGDIGLRAFAFAIELYGGRTLAGGPRGTRDAPPPRRSHTPSLHAPPPSLARPPQLRLL